VGVTARLQSAAPSDGGRSHAESTVARSVYGGTGGRGAAAGGGGTLSRQPSERSTYSRAQSARGPRGGHGEDDTRSAWQSQVGWRGVAGRRGERLGAWPGSRKVGGVAWLTRRHGSGSLGRRRRHGSKHDAQGQRNGRVQRVQGFTGAV
jgi:hypothetical protein